ncbi:hypothetical protein LJR234_001324 [Mesorhizobium amorphae]|uniref:hypothetical protein n=1 Tax=Mesorhizobium amorphae TaxID=71433 RepID=UPI003ECFF31F
MSWLRQPGGGVPPDYSAGAREDHREPSCIVGGGEIILKKCACKNVDFHSPRSSCGRPWVRGRMEVKMDNLFFALWKRPGRKAERPEDFWLHPPPSGLGRLLAAVAIIAVAACLLDHAAAVKGPADSVTAASYGSSLQGSQK